MANFGWSYPAGAGNDPYAPYNQIDDHVDNSDFEQQFSDFDSLYQMYRAIYKATPCGPTIGVTVWPEEPGGSGSATYYNSDLDLLGSFEDMNGDGLIITSIQVSSIVEGSDADVEPIIIEWDPFDEEPEDLAQDFWDAVEEVNQEAMEVNPHA